MKTSIGKSATRRKDFFQIGSLVIGVLCAVGLTQCLTLWSLEKSFVAQISMRLEKEELIEQPDSCLAFVQLAANTILESTHGRMGVSSAINDSWLLPLSPTLSMAVFGQGACGNISLLTVEVFDNLGKEAKAVQVLNAEGGTMHVIVEIQMECGTVFVDPLYAWVYQDENKPVQSEVLKSKWTNFIHGAPSGLVRFPVNDNLRYTNWSTLGVLALPMKNLISFAMGSDNIDEFSLRSVLPGFYESRIISWSLVLLALFVVRIKLS